LARASPSTPRTSLYHTLSLSLSFSLPLSLINTHSLYLLVSLSNTHSLPHTLSLSNSHKLSLSLTHTHTHSLSPSLYLASAATSRGFARSSPSTPRTHQVPETRKPRKKSIVQLGSPYKFKTRWYKTSFKRAPGQRSQEPGLCPLVAQHSPHLRV